MNNFKQNYIERIKNASPVQLITITFELTIVNLEDYKNCVDNEQREYHIKKAQSFLMQLMSSLDMKYPISNHLLNIYLYINKLLHEIYFDKNLDKIDVCIDMLKSLLSSFEFIENDKLKYSNEYSLNMYYSFAYKNNTIKDYMFKESENKYQA